MRRFSRLAAAIAVSFAIVNPATAQDGGQHHQEADAQAPLVSDDYECTHPPYNIHLLSKSPLVIYISDFITPSERKHLLNLAAPTFSRSSILDSSGNSAHNTVRTSQSTSIPRRDPVVKCIQSRALLFQGLPPSAKSRLEPLQLVKYAPTEHYHFHTDWFTAPSPADARSGNRQSSFFAYVDVANGTTGGGTNFPLIDAPREDAGEDGERSGWSWCEFVDCDAPWEDGVTFRPREGSAVYWENLHPDGTGDVRTLHAGLPVAAGGKVGMNIWTRQGPLPEEVLGEE